MMKECDALGARIEALGKLLDEREERTKDRFSAMEKAVATAFQNSERAIDKADASNQRHFAQVNEFRQSLQDQTSKYLEKTVYDVQHKMLADKLETIYVRFTQMEAKSVVSQWIFGIVVALAAPSVAIIIYLFERSK
jgi:membrane-associated HD superfamily phosphohydrolase